VSGPTNYALTVWACRRADNSPITAWQARAEWSSPERQVTGAPGATEAEAIGNAVAAMKERDAMLSEALETGAFV
jgi:hypothetical protein